MSLFFPPWSILPNSTEVKLTYFKSLKNRVENESEVQNDNKWDSILKEEFEKALRGLKANKAPEVNLPIWQFKLAMRGLVVDKRTNQYGYRWASRSIVYTILKPDAHSLTQ